MEIKTKATLFRNWTVDRGCNLEITDGCLQILLLVINGMLIDVGNIVRLGIDLFSPDDSGHNLELGCDFLSLISWQIIVTFGRRLENSFSLV